MNVQMRLITADNIEQLTKQGDRTIYEKQLYTNLPSPKEEDLLERIKRENEEQEKVLAVEDKIRLKKRKLADFQQEIQAEIDKQQEMYAEDPRI
jgi:hypothetical protein